MFDEIVNEIKARCKNPLETQSSIAQSYASMLRYLDLISDEKIEIANNAIKERYPSKSGFLRVKKMAWAIIEQSSVRKKSEKNFNKIKVGTKVMKDGYEGTVIRVCEWDNDLIEVRLASGMVCVAKSNFNGQYNNNYIISL